MLQVSAELQKQPWRKTFKNIFNEEKKKKTRIIRYLR